MLTQLHAIHARLTAHVKALSHRHPELLKVGTKALTGVDFVKEDYASLCLHSEVFTLKAHEGNVDATINSLVRQFDEAFMHLPQPIYVHMSMPYINYVPGQVHLGSDAVMVDCALYSYDGQTLRTLSVTPTYKGPVYTINAQSHTLAVISPFKVKVYAENVQRDLKHMDINQMVEAFDQSVAAARQHLLEVQRVDYDWQNLPDPTDEEPRDDWAGERHPPIVIPGDSRAGKAMHAAYSAIKIDPLKFIRAISEYFGRPVTIIGLNDHIEGYRFDDQIVDGPTLIRWIAEDYHSQQSNE